ncbi:putative nitrate transporter NarT [Abditibacteriota bacterium]|nr:putative nitrate transporter NarT [Abditibacteriota bacterium]
MNSTLESARSASPPLASGTSVTDVNLTERAYDRLRRSVLLFSSANFTLLFAVWLMFGVLSIPIQKELGLSDMQVGWLTALPILNGAIWRLNFGILADRLGGRRVFTALMLFTAVPVFLVTFAHSFTQLLVAAFFIGFAGNAFSVGVSWNSAWFPKERQGGALGLFGAGNVGASITKIGAPLLLAALPAAGLLGLVGWRVIPPIYAVLLLMGALWMWFRTPSTDHKPGQGRPMSELLLPLRRVQVWRFSLYYVVVFGAYVALSNWLPKFFVSTYGVSLSEAGLITALFIFPASLLRPVGGVLSDRMGARGLMYGTFFVMILASAPMAAFPLPLWVFAALLFVVGVAMGIGKAAVFRFIPTYYPREVGSVGGLVGALGALGGFALTPAFAYIGALTHAKHTALALLCLLSLVSLVWFHLSVLGMKRRANQLLTVPN